MRKFLIGLFASVGLLCGVWAAAEASYTFSYTTQPGVTQAYCDQQVAEHTGTFNGKTYVVTGVFDPVTTRCTLTFVVTP